MTGASDVQIARPRSTISGPLAVAFSPSTHCFAKLLDACARSDIDCSKSYATIGIVRLISKLPLCPPTVIAASLPMTCRQTMSTYSQMTGLTLPGMIDEPGCTAGNSISPMPALGPEPSQRMSLAIFVSETATVLSAPLAATQLSNEDCAWK